MYKMYKVRRAGLAGADDQRGLAVVKSRLQLTQKVQVDRGLNTDKLAAMCSAMPCYSLRSRYKEELNKCSNRL